MPHGISKDRQSAKVLHQAAAPSNGPACEGFCLYTQGPLRLAVPRILRFASPPVQIWIWALLLWLPLAFESGPSSQANTARILITLPFLLYSGKVLDLRIQKAVPYFSERCSLPHRISLAVSKACRWRDSKWINFGTLLIPIGLLIKRMNSLSLIGVDFHSWASFPKVWQSLVILSIAHYFISIWLIRTMTWIYLLWIFSKADLNVYPAHPDGRGGLGILNWVQTPFSWVTLGFGFLLMAEVFSEIPKLDLSLLEPALKNLGLFLLINFLVFLGPLLFFTPRLCEIKVALEMSYHSFSTDCAKRFEHRWILSETRTEPSAHEEKNGTGDLPSDISVFCDLNPVDEKARKMAPVLPDLIVLRRFAIAACLPLIPILLVRIPLEQWIQILKKILF